MKPINKEELYQNLSGFLQTKGIELKEGTYTRRIQKGCNLLADVVNLAQEGLERAKTEVDKKLDQMRHVIHEKTAPRRSSGPSASETPRAKGGNAAPTAARKKASAGGKKPKRKARKL